MKQNLMAYRNVQALAAELGVPYVLDMTITPKMDGDMILLQLRNSAQELLPILQDTTLNPSLCSTDSADETSLGSATSSGMKSQAYEDYPGSAGHNSCYISPYGDVFPCVQMPVATGNLRQQRFDEIWFGSPEMNRVRAVRESQLPVCSKCSIRQYCERCPGLAQMEGGDLLGAYERACDLAELKAQLAGVQNPISALHAQKSGGKELCSIPSPVAAPAVQIGSN